MSNISWFKVWYIDDRGNDCEVKYIKTYNCKEVLNASDRECELHAFISEFYPNLPKTSYLHWEEVTTLPYIFIASEIRKHQYTIANVAKIVSDAQHAINELNSMRETK